MTVDLTKAEFETWLEDRVTRIVLDLHRDEIQAMKDFMGRGGTYNAEGAEYTHAATAHAVGYISGLSKIFQVNDTLWLVTKEEKLDD